METQKIQINKEVDWELWNYFLDLEKDWQALLPKITGKELLEIFPEARSYLKHKLKSYKKEVRKLTFEIRKDLKKIYKSVKDEFAIWFNEEIVRVWKGERLNQLYKEIRKWEYLLNPEIKKSEITDSMIERARDYPFKDLVGTSRSTKKDFILCPFHSEKRPSFYIKNNWGYCFACGWHGDTIKFLMERDGLTFQEAVKYLT